MRELGDRNSSNGELGCPWGSSEDADWSPESLLALMVFASAETALLMVISDFCLQLVLAPQMDVKATASREKMRFLVDFHFSDTHNFSGS
jgi:hypothetical protein